MDLKLERLLPGDRQFTWQTEFLYRQYELGLDNNLGLASTDIEDYRFYKQAMYEFAPKFSLGLRYEFGSGDEDGTTTPDADDDRAVRHRFSPMLR